MSEAENYAARAREAVTVALEWETGHGYVPAFRLVIDGETLGPNGWMPTDPNQTAQSFFREVEDGLMVAQQVYAYMLGKQGLSQEDFDSVLVGMTPVETPPEGVPLDQLLNITVSEGVPPGSFFIGSNEDVRLFHFGRGQNQVGDYEQTDEPWAVIGRPAPESHPIFPDPEYNEATDADTDLAGDETTGG